MFYRSSAAISNELYVIKVPHCDGKAIGCTGFANVHAAYEVLPGEVKQKLANAMATP